MRKGRRTRARSTRSEGDPCESVNNAKIASTRASSCHVAWPHQGEVKQFEILYVEAWAATGQGRSRGSRAWAAREGVRVEGGGREFSPRTAEAEAGAWKPAGGSGEGGGRKVVRADLPPWRGVSPPADSRVRAEAEASGALRGAFRRHQASFATAPTLAAGDPFPRGSAGEGGGGQQWRAPSIAQQVPPLPFRAPGGLHVGCHPLLYPYLD